MTLNNLWTLYINGLKNVDNISKKLLRSAIDEIGIDNKEELIKYFASILSEYGDASSELACQLYDGICELEGVAYASAEPIESITEEVVKATVNDALTHSELGNTLLNESLALLKKQANETLLKNGKRDGAQFAWIPSGSETCAFCITLASNGWRYINSKTHADHIHANCDCNYCIRHKDTTNIKDYNPDKYLEMYNRNGGDINSMRRELYQQNKEKILDQKSIARFNRLKAEE